MNDAPGSEDEDFEVLALGRLSRVIGAGAARRLHGEVLRAIGLTRLRTADDLYAFGKELSKRGGFEAAVGGLLSVAAVLRGASRPGPHG